MLVEKTFQGAIKITESGLTRQYFGYSKKESISRFRDEKKRLLTSQK